MKLTTGIQMPDFSYIDPYKEGTQNFTSLANGKKTYVVFLRYYGCTVCRLDLHIFAQRYKEFQDKNTDLVVVLQSNPNLVKKEAPEGTFPFVIACDEKQEVYKQFEIMPATNKLKLAGNPFKALKKIKTAEKFGFAHGEFEGNEEQLPAIALVNETGNIEFVHYAKSIIDMPSVDEMLAKL